MTRLALATVITLLCSTESAAPDRTTESGAAVEAAPLAAVEIQEWPVPYPDSRPRDPDIDANGRVWFVGQRTHYIALLDPGSGEFRRYDLGQGTGPHNLIIDQGGAVWYAGNLVAHIGRLDPATGEIRTFPTPVRDPHTLTFAPDGSIWFTAQIGNKVGRFDPATGDVRLIDVATPSARPYGIVVDGAGRPWVALFGTSKIGVVDPAAMTIEEIDLPRAEARARRIAITPDGAIWYVDYAGGTLGRIDPATRAIREWNAPAEARSRPYAMAADSAGRVWFVETGPQPNRFVGFDPRTETFTEPVEIASGGGAVRHMVFDRASGAIWFGTDTNTIGRALLPEP